jgi:hypothetical protein
MHSYVSDGHAQSIMDNVVFIIHLADFSPRSDGITECRELRACPQNVGTWHNTHTKYY